MEQAHFIRSIQSYKRVKNGLEFWCLSDNGGRIPLKIEIMEDDIIRIRMSAKEKIAKKEEYLIIKKDWKNPDFKLKESQADINIITKKLKVKVSKNPWQICLEDFHKNLIFQEMVNTNLLLDGNSGAKPVGFHNNTDDDRFTVWETAALRDDEHFYGFGESFSPIDKKGCEIISWASDAGVATPKMYKNVPFFMSSRGYGLFVNTTCRIRWNIGNKSLISYSFEIYDSELDYFLIYGPKFKDILYKYTEITGRAPMPPKWSFGLWMSTKGKQNREEVEKVAQGMRERDIPCDVIYLDTIWLGERSNLCNLEWDEKKFPKPEQMIKGLREKGFKVFLWISPYVSTTTKMYQEGVKKGFFILGQDGNLKLLPIWSGENIKLAVIDLTNPGAVNWYKARLKRLLEMGVNAFKVDFGEAAPEDGIYYNGKSGQEMHNLYPLFYNKVVFEVTNEGTAGEGVICARPAYAGSQCYPFHWAGDPHATFEHMACVLRGGLSLGLSGIPFWSHDIGGFYGHSNPVLYIRWAQFGFFCSHTRCHGTHSREPWVFGKEALTIFRKYAKLKYRLIPYIYSCAKISTETGVPMIRPLILGYQDDPNTYHIDSEYLFGEFFLIAPIFSEKNERDVYLPQGEWVDYWTKEIINGGKYIKYNAPLDKLPIFVKEGAIIPMGPEISYVGEKDISEFTIDIYPCRSSQFTMYDEKINAVTFKCRKVDKKLLFDILANNSQTMKFVLVFNNTAKPVKVTKNRVTLPECKSKEKFARKDQCWCSSGGRVLVKAKVTETIQIALDLVKIPIRAERRQK